MKRFFRIMMVAFFCAALSSAQTAVVTRNVNLRSDASTNKKPVGKLKSGAKLQLLESDPVDGYYHVQMSSGKRGFVWGKNIRVQEAAASTSGPSTPNRPPAGGETPSHAPTPSGEGGLTPLLAKGHPVDWWFVFKFNSAKFPGCTQGAARACLFGGTVQNYKAFSQQFVYASSEAHKLQAGDVCAGDTTDDPVGATFDEVYNGSFNFVTWNDQFYNDPQISGCGTSCSSPWGHSKGMLAWDNDGNGLVLQVTTPSWPGAGSAESPRKTDGNTLGCVKDNDVQVSQHFFALKLSKDDVVKVLAALQNASVVTDPQNPQIVKNGGPEDIQGLVEKLGTKSTSHTFTSGTLSSGVELISKPSGLHVPPWQMVSSILDGASLRTATWWASPQIYSTTSTTKIACWDTSLSQPGAIAIATTGHWQDTEFGLTGGLGTNFNHAKLGVSTSGNKHYAIFGDMNQQGTISGPNCASSQNGRGGLFYVVDDEELSAGLAALIDGNTAPTSAPPK
jgi:hypothetical protein